MKEALCNLGVYPQEWSELQLLRPQAGSAGNRSFALTLMHFDATTTATQAGAQVGSHISSNTCQNQTQHGHLPAIQHLIFVGRNWWWHMCC